MNLTKFIVDLNTMHVMEYLSEMNMTNLTDFTHITDFSDFINFTNFYNFTHFYNLTNFQNISHFTNTTRINRIIEEYAKRERNLESLAEILFSILYTLSMISGFVSNVFVLAFILLNKKLRKSNHLLLINLFVANILICLFCIPFTLYVLIYRSWDYSSFVCKAIPFMQAVSIYVASLSITFISIDRWIQVTSYTFVGNVNLSSQSHL